MRTRFAEIDRTEVDGCAAGARCLDRHRRRGAGCRSRETGLYGRRSSAPPRQYGSRIHLPTEGVGDDVARTGNAVGGRRAARNGRSRRLEDGEDVARRHRTRDCDTRAAENGGVGEVRSRRCRDRPKSPATTHGRVERDLNGVGRRIELQRRAGDGGTSGHEALAAEVNIPGVRSRSPAGEPGYISGALTSGGCKGELIVPGGRGGVTPNCHRTGDTERARLA